jgi:hypothetical protein
MRTIRCTVPRTVLRARSLLLGGRHLGAAATLIAGLGERASAQPACAAGPLSGYLAPGFQCQVGGWRFFDFQWVTFAAAAPGTTASAPDALGTTTFLTPFTGVDALGRSTFGFEFTGFATDATAEAGPAAPFSGIGSSTAQMAFQAESIDPLGVLSKTLLDYLLEGSTATPNLTTVVSLVQAIGGPTVGGTGGFCLTVTDVLTGPGGGARTAEYTCGSPNQNSLTPILVIGSNSFQSADPAGASGATGARLDRLTFVAGAPQAVVPEPAVAALLAGGLLALGGVAARRRA